MRVLTFGWDYPPLKNGGLGVACHGLCEELINAGCEVIFVLPRNQKTVGRYKFIFADRGVGQRIYTVDSPLLPYKHSDSFLEFFDDTTKRLRLSRRVIDEVHRYAEVAREIALRENFDVIHAHDWTSYLAGVAAKLATQKPLILHVHATSFDQAGGQNVDPDIYDIERTSFHKADSVIAVSNYTKHIVTEKYGVPDEKVEVVYNGIWQQKERELPPALEDLKRQGKKIVFYNGRITIQKGVDKFVEAARKVVDVDEDVIFIITGWGDMEQQIMHQVGALGLSKNVIFTGALWDDERDRLYQAADLFVMPSVSEPFGLVPLEALQQGTPVLISKQSGVSEVLKNALKVDFWDIDEMANKILSALRYPVMRRQLANEGRFELGNLTWQRAAQKVVDVYKSLLDWLRRKG